MRIGVLTTSYPRDVNDGAGHFVAGFAHWLRDHVGDVDVLCASDRWPLFYRGGAPAALARAPLRSLVYGTAFSLQLWRAAARLRASWDAIVTHWTVPCGVIGRAIQTRTMRHLCIAHGSDVRLARKLRMASAIGFVLGRSAELVYVAEGMTLPGRPGPIVPMGIELEQFPRLKNRRTERKGASFRLLYVGRLSVEKGIDLLLAALPADVELTVAGDGPERSAAQKLARGKNVTFLGHVNRSELPTLYAAHDLLIVPSRTDGSPTVVREAMAVGLPVLATRVGGLAHMIAHGTGGWLCAPTSEGLADAIDALRNKPILLDKMADGAAAHAENFDWAKVAPRLWGDLTYNQTGSLRVIRV